LCLARWVGECGANGKCHANSSIYLQGSPCHIHWVQRPFEFIRVGSPQYIIRGMYVYDLYTISICFVLINFHESIINLILLINYGKHPCYPPPPTWMDKYRANSRNQPWTQPSFWVIIAKTLIVDVEAISTMLVLFYFVEIKLIQPLVGANVTRKF
jgi:hypothetical protein